MKNKRNTYVLLILVFTVWGVIAYRIFSSLKAKPIKDQQTTAQTSFRPKPVKEQDSFNIHQYHRDPFLGVLKSKPKIAEVKKILTQKKEIKWPEIRYSGFIEKPDKTEQIFFIYIDNKQYLLKPKKEMQGIKLIKGDQREIVLQYKGAQKTITAQ